MTSVFCTGVMGFERYVRFKFICQFRLCTWITQQNFIYYLMVIVIFPILFYFPKFFELTYAEKDIDCR